MNLTGKKCLTEMFLIPPRSYYELTWEESSCTSTAIGSLRLFSWGRGGRTLTKTFTLPESAMPNVKYELTLLIPYTEKFQFFINAPRETAPSSSAGCLSRAYRPLGTYKAIFLLCQWRWKVPYFFLYSILPLPPEKKITIKNCSAK